MTAEAGTAVEVDPLSFAVVAGALDSVVREMTITMVKSSRSPILTEGYDFSNSLFDAEARMVIQGHNIPVHVGAMIDAGKSVTQFFEGEIDAGDVIYCNDPAFEGSHLPDMTMYKPVFYDDELVFWAANKSHMMDTGGPVAGGYNPYAQDLFGEGLRISPIKLYEQGRERRDVINLLMSNVRLPQALRGDLRAQLAAVSTAEARLTALLEKYGVRTIRACCAGMLDRAESLMVREIEQMCEGTFEGRSVVEDYGHGLGDTELHASVVIRDARLHVKLSAPPQANSYLNSYANGTKSMVYFAILAHVTPEIPHNEGLYRPISIDLGPEGSRVNARIPAACAQSTGSLADAIWDAVADALSKASPDRACAAWCRPYNAIYAGVHPRTGERWADYSLGAAMGGGGASTGADGWDAVGWVNAAGACHHGDIESMELKEPIRIWRHELRKDSACPGRWRGGFGTTHELELLAEAQLANVADGTIYPSPSRPPREVAFPERKVHSRWIRHPDGRTEEARPQTVVQLAASSRVESWSAGGGGVANPFERDPWLVSLDVRQELVSIECARSEYGVVINPATMELDADSTQSLRSIQASSTRAPRGSVAAHTVAGS